MSTADEPADELPQKVRVAWEVARRTKDPDVALAALRALAGEVTHRIREAAVRAEAAREVVRSAEAVQEMGEIVLDDLARGIAHVEAARTQARRTEEEGQ
jgi:hypothetical protein